MSAEDLDLASRFLAALGNAAQTGDRSAVYPFLAPDVQWVTPQRELRGSDQVRDELTWVEPPDGLDIEFGEPMLTDRDGGKVVAVAHEIYRVQGTEEVAYERDRQVELTLSDGRILRYEMRIVG